MEKERSKSVQEVSEQSKNNSETINPRRYQIRDVTAKRSKRHIIQYAAPEITITDSRSGYLGDVDRSHHGKKQSLLKRLSDCSLSPCSEEYKFVMRGFKETERESNSTVHVATTKRTRNRKISSNNFSQGSKCSSVRLPSELESALTLRSRPRGNTMPARICDIRIAGETQLSVNTKAAVQKHVSVHVKLAWQSVNEVKRETTKPVPLSDLPQKQLSEDKHKKERKSVETFRNDREVLSGREDRSGRRTPQRKKAEKELPKIAERVFIDHDHLQVKLKDTDISYEHRRKSFTDEQTDDVKNSRDGENFLTTHPERVLSFSGENFSEGKDITRVKGKLTYTRSWEPRPRTENSLARRNIDTESKSSVQLRSRRRTSQFAITRANISHVGKAALTATRLLKIHHRENGAKREIRREEKELDELFEEMKDCRYLRKSTSDMKI